MAIFASQHLILGALIISTIVVDLMMIRNLLFTFVYSRNYFFIIFEVLQLKLFMPFEI